MRMNCSGATPRVSVVIPAYNAADTLETTLASVIAQDLPEWEAIVVDDGSTDDTRRRVRQLAACDPRITLAGGARRGVSAARNLGVAMAHAPVVAFLDADDQWAPSKLSAQLAHLAARPDVGVSFTRARFLTPEGVPTAAVSSGRTRGLEPAHLLHNNPATTASTLCVRRAVFETVGGFDEGMSFAEDLEWLIRACSLSGWRVEGLDAPLTAYRTSRAGLSSDLERMRLGWEGMVARVARYAPAVVARHGRAARAAQLRYLARRALRLGLAPETSLAYLRAALGTDWRIALRDPYGVAGTAAVALARRLLPGPRSRRVADSTGLQP